MRKIRLGEINRLKALRKMKKDTFYADELDFKYGAGGGDMLSLRCGGWIEPTGRTKEVWYRVNKDTMKRGLAKEWRKTPKAINHLTHFLELVEEINQYLEW